ncbi:unnamed protein product [Camellia sinensis]
MASPGNQNQPGGPFDMHKFFKPSPNPISPNPNTNLSSSPFSPSSAYPPPPSSSYPPPTGPYQFHQPQFHIPSYPQQDHQRSISYPTPPLQSPPPHHLPPQNPNAGARLMALLSAPPSTLELPQLPTVPPIAPIQPSSSGSSDFSMPMPSNVPILPAVPLAPNVNPGVIAHSAPMRMASSKLPKGRHLIGDRAVYDIDVRMEGEVQPQLEVTPITKYVSDPGLVLGRQIAVNKTYICYGLKMGAIRVLNINTALRSLLKGLAQQRVTDMAFFAEDVHLLASASIVGRVYVWKITEGPDEEDKPQITGKIVIAIQIVGEGDSVHPRVCWHCHKQEVLVVGIGKRVLRIDTTKVGKGEVFSAEEPLKCPVDNLIDGIQFVGKHDGEVTDLSMCQWMTTRLVSASTDGTIKIWEDRKLQPLVVLRPHDGQPVNSVTFLTAPHRPDHIILITGGPLNREVKIWASASEEGWLLPSDSESWQCTQTLDLKSSSESRVEEVFFNQVVALSQAGLLLLANAKKNAIYAVHLEYGYNPAATRMDYIAEFTVTMPILSFTGTSDLLPHGEHIVQVYCVQTQAIQQYALDLSQCLPPPLENVVLEKSDSSVLRDATSMEGVTTSETSGSSESAPITITRNPMGSTSMDTATSAEFATFEPRPISLPTVSSNNDVSCIASPPLPLSPKLSGKLSGFRSPTNGFEPGPVLDDRGGDQQAIEYSVDRQMDTVHTNLSDVPSLDDDSKNGENKGVRMILPLFSISILSSSTQLIWESQTFKMWLSTVMCAMLRWMLRLWGETGSSQNNEIGSQVESPNLVPENKERVFCSQASDLGIEMARECSVLSSEMYIVEESQQLDGANVSEALAQPSNVEEEVHDSTKDASGKNVGSAMPAAVPQQMTPTTKGKKQKGKNAQGSGPSSPIPSAFNSTDSSEPGVSSSIPSVEAVSAKIMAMQEMLNQEPVNNHAKRNAEADDSDGCCPSY